MRKAVTSRFGLLVFVGLVTTSLLAVFNGHPVDGHLLQNHLYNHVYFMAY